MKHIAMKAYELIFEDRKEYLYVLVAGELDRKSDLEIDAEIKLECEKRDRNTVLIDIRNSSSRISFLENFVAATTYRERMGPQIKAIAIVDAREFKENSDVFELTAVNLGAPVKFFSSTIDAEEWLVGDRGQVPSRND